MSLLYVSIGVRKGSRISNWNRVIGTVCSLLHTANLIEDTNSVDFQILATVAVAAQYCPLDVVTSKWNIISKEILEKNTIPQFLPFCNFFANLGEERFRSVLYPVLMQYVCPKVRHLPKLTCIQRYISGNWNFEEEKLGALLIRLRDTEKLRKIDGQPLALPRSWEARIEDAFHTLASNQGIEVSASLHLFLMCNAYLEFKTTFNFSDWISDCISTCISKAFRSLHKVPWPKGQFKALMFGNGLIWYVEHMTDFGKSSIQTCGIGFAPRLKRQQEFLNSSKLFCFTYRNQTRACVWKALISKPFYIIYCETWLDHLTYCA